MINISRKIVTVRTPKKPKMFNGIEFLFANKVTLKMNKTLAITRFFCYN